jgi:hypothetical protein
LPGFWRVLSPHTAFFIVECRYPASIVYLRRACYVAAIGATFSSHLTLLVLSCNSPSMSRTLPKKTNPLILSDASPACKSHLEARGRATAHATDIPPYHFYPNLIFWP